MPIMLLFVGIAAGAIVSAGIGALFTTVDVVNRLAYKSHTLSKSHLYEKCIIAGAISGGIISVFSEEVGDIISSNGIIAKGIIVFCGALFTGIFVGCLAMSIDEALDASTIFFRRLNIKKYIRYIVMAIALGKLMGNYLYFLY